MLTSYTRTTPRYITNLVDVFSMHEFTVHLQIVVPDCPIFRVCILKPNVVFFGDSVNTVLVEDIYRR